MSESLPRELDEVLGDLGRCIRALGPYTETAVLTGGLAAMLYRWCWPNSSIERPPLMTFDMDWALPQRMQWHDAGLHKRLESGGFRPWLHGSGDDPVTYYQHERHGTARLARIYAEFIAPRPGSLTDRQGKNAGIVEIEPGLHAQTDPYLGLLLVENLKLDVSRVAGIGLSEPQSIRLPHPICYVVQKVLIRRRRPPHKQANDAAHVYEVALITRDAWPQMADVLARVEAGGAFPPKWFERARQTIDEIFLGPDAVGPVEVARIYQAGAGPASGPTEAAVSRVLRQFFAATGLQGR